MNMKKLTTLLLTATLGLCQRAWRRTPVPSPIMARPTLPRMPVEVAPDARENVAPNNVDNSQINSGSGAPRARR